MNEKYVTFEDVFELVEPEVQELASTVMNDIEDMSLAAMSAFYADYSPDVYNRTGQLVGVIGYPSMSKTSKGYRVIFPFNAVDNNRFNGPFCQGFHGPPWGGKRIAPQMRPSPWEEIRDYAKSTYNAYEL